MSVLLSSVLLLAADSVSKKPDRDRDSYWQCDNKIMGENRGSHRAYFASIVDDNGQIWYPSYQVIQSNARFRYGTVENLREDRFVISTILVHHIPIKQIPDQPIWQFVYADQELVQVDIQVSPELIRKGEAHKTIWGSRIKGGAVAKLTEAEKWTLRLVKQDGTIIEERSLKDQSLKELDADQDFLMNWAIRAARNPKDHCWRSTPEVRHQMLESITH